MISYEFNDGEGQKAGGIMLVKWYESGGVENIQRPMRFIHGFFDPKCYWSLCRNSGFFRNNLETLASLEEINGYKYSTFFSSRRNNLFNQKSRAIVHPSIHFTNFIELRS